MAELNRIETAQAQDFTTKMRGQVTAIRAQQKELQALLETWEYLKAFHTYDEITKALSGENEGLTFDLVQNAVDALQTMGAALDDANHPERKLALIALSYANVKG